MKKPLIVVSLCAVVLLILGSLSNVVGYQTQMKEDNNSTSEERPDLIIVGVEGHYDAQFGGFFRCVFKNIGTTPIEDYQLQIDGYRGFGLRHFIHSNIGGHTNLEPGETRDYPFDCPPLFIGVLRLRCHISTSIPEEDMTNNRFAHSFFVVNLGPFWFFKELPL